MRAGVRRGRRVRVRSRGFIFLGREGKFGGVDVDLGWFDGDVGVGFGGMVCGGVGIRGGEGGLY